MLYGKNDTYNKIRDEDILEEASVWEKTLPSKLTYGELLKIKSVKKYFGTFLKEINMTEKDFLKDLENNSLYEKMLIKQMIF